MKKTENIYQRGKIYKLISNQTTDAYYGSTIEPRLSNRLSDHRSDYKKWLNGHHYYVTSYEIIKFGDAQIVLVENFPCNSRDELRARENYFIENHACVNKCKAFIGLSRQEYLKQYYNEHKNEIAQQKKKYCQDNKNEISQKKKLYEEKNKSKIAQIHKQYYENNKEEIKQKNIQYRHENRDIIA